MKGWIIAALLAVACKERAPRVSEADFSHAAIVARVEVLRPDVEAVLGDAIGPVTVHVATADEIRVQLVPDLQRSQNAIEGGPRGNALKKECEAEAAVRSKATLGLVPADTGELHVCPENFHNSADVATEWAELDSQDGLDIILIHELVHVWQHHRFDLKRLIGSPTSYDELFARAALVEGHAQFITRAVARRRGIEAAFDLFVSTHTEIPESISDVAQRESVQVRVAQASFPYVEGLRLWDEVVAELGLEAATKRLYEQPPRSSEAVARAGEYLNPRPPSAFDLDRATRALRRYLDEREKGPATVRPLLRPTLRVGLQDGGPAAEVALRGFVRGRAISARRVILAVVLHDGPAAARALFDATQVTQRTKAQRHAAGSIRVRVHTDEPVRVGALDAHFFHVEFRSGKTRTFDRVAFNDGAVTVDLIVFNGARPRTLRLAERVAELLAKPSPWTGQPREEAIATMQASLAHADWGVRWRAVRNLARLMKERGELKRYVARGLRDASPHVRIEALKALGLSRAAELADDPDWEVRREYLARHARDDDVPAKTRGAELVKRLGDASVEVQLLACKELSLLDEEEQVPFETLKTLMGADDGRVRAEAIDLFPYAGPGKYGELLIAALDDPVAAVRAEAAEKLGSYRRIAKHCVPKLILLLEDPEVDVREGAVDSLGDFGRKAADAVPSLILLLDDKEVRNNAVWALKKMGPHALLARVQLVDALESEDRYFAFIAAEALAEQGYDNEKLLPVVVETLRTNDLYRHEAAEMLSHMGELAHPYVDDMVKLLKVKDSQVTRARVAEALGRLGPAAKAALPTLRELAEHDVDDVRKRAKEAIRRIEGS